MYESFERGFCKVLNCEPSQLTEQGRSFIKQAYLNAQQPPQKRPFYKNPWVLGGAAALGAGAYAALGNPKQDFQNLSGMLQKGRDALFGGKAVPTPQTPAPAPNLKLDEGRTDALKGGDPLKLDYGAGNLMQENNATHMGIGNGSVDPFAADAEKGVNKALTDFYNERARRGQTNIGAEGDTSLPPWMHAAQATGGGAALGGAGLQMFQKTAPVGRALSPLGLLLDIPAGNRLGTIAADGYGIQNPLGRKAMGYLGAADATALNVYLAARTGGLGMASKLPLISKIPQAAGTAAKMFGMADMGATIGLGAGVDQLDKSLNMNDNVTLNGNIYSSLEDSFNNAYNRSQTDPSAMQEWVNKYRALIPAMHSALSEGKQNTELQNNAGTVKNWLWRQLGRHQATAYSPATLNRFEQAVKPYQPLP